MSTSRVQRASDSPFVEAITHVTYDSHVHDMTTPDGLWDLVIQKYAGKIAVLQTGLITRPVALDYGPGDEYLSISFKPGVFMPRLPGVQMVDTGVARPTLSKRSFALDSEAFEIPTFENAEGLVERLVRRDVIVRDEIVGGRGRGPSGGHVLANGAASLPVDAWLTAQAARTDPAGGAGRHDAGGGATGGGRGRRPRLRGPGAPDTIAEALHGAHTRRDRESASETLTAQHHQGAQCRFCSRPRGTGLPIVPSWISLRSA